MARPTDCTEDVTLEIAAALELGLSVADACALAGIARATFHNWTNRGEAGESPFVEFLDLIREARARGRQKHAQAITNAVADDWRAAAFFLERSDPKRWGRRDTKDVNQKNSGQITIRVVYVRDHAALASAASLASDDPGTSPALQRRRMWETFRQDGHGDAEAN